MSSPTTKPFHVTNSIVTAKRIARKIYNVLSFIDKEAENLESSTQEDLLFKEIIDPPIKYVTDKTKAFWEEVNH